LNGILPTNWDIEEECAGTGLFYAKAVVATDGEAITGVTIGTDAGGTIVGQTDSATASGLTTYTFASLTSVAASGTTTTWSSSSSETSTGAGSISNTGIEYDENGDPQTTQTLSTGSFGGRQFRI
jgi:hypothetical protein